MTDDDFHCDCVDWRPLEAILPIEECAGFMYMGWLDVNGRRLHHYKHPLTRRYLFITDELETYRYRPDETYVPVGVQRAVLVALEDLERFEPDEYPRGRVRRLAAECARRLRLSKGMLAYHEKDNGEAPR